MKNRGSFSFRIFALALVFLLLYRACSPPDVGAGQAERILSVGQVYQDVHHTTNLPVIVSGEVMSSLFVGALGGFFFLQDPHSRTTLLCLTRNFPPPDGASVHVFGIVKPLLCRGNMNVLYVKTKEVAWNESIRSNFP